ncbi:acetyltransferase (GNAT) domain-containing protein [Hirsutella rhossiliensis]|uniref:Acetyltransferase (GNAT) domain-containing protein n=1 Tax=Hirsutella rhossiliensis TaxID=111463 RepID=A0A9P8N1C4_9HYPO|nr:acetyltransferase (GNAT) domain-containing protein [Hirsutella rhossiliensis]KAH0964792.1 acetyltransferase (GNAT) domain-containing protein [Hirsutella rhossiliensis]
MDTGTLRKRSPIKIRLPHPYLTTYYLEPSSKTADGNVPSYHFRQGDTSKPAQVFAQPLHNEQIHFSRLAPLESDNVPDSDNTAWARARRSPVWTVTWEGAELPTVAQVWLFLYAFFTVDHETETFRLRLCGPGTHALVRSLCLSMVAVEHPLPVDGPDQFERRQDEVLVLRSAFWQGCASPLGSQPIWLPSRSAVAVVPHLEYTLMPTGPTFLRHPRRYPKPTPGSVIYSRYIPSLDEHFSLLALDYTNPEHLNLFHTWQNDPRVAQGWKETGTLEEHREYLRAMHEDPHVMAVLGRFDDAPFAYFEVYWAKEDKMGAHYAALDFDRGRHSLVGDPAYRGLHRVMAWWPSVMHYLFLDDHRTENVVGEPRLSNDKVLMYEYMFGLHQDKYLDLPHKRSSLVKCSRERFFQVCPFGQNTQHVAGTNFGFKPRL